MAKDRKKKYDDDDDDENVDKAADMILWTRRLAFFLAFAAFTTMFIVKHDFTPPQVFETKVLIVSAVWGFGAALLLWMIGLIIGNIFLKGLITDVPVDQDHLVEGGLLQRIYLYQQRLNYDTDANVIQFDPRTDSIVKKTVREKNKKQG